MTFSGYVTSIEPGDWLLISAHDPHDTVVARGTRGECERVAKARAVRHPVLVRVCAVAAKGGGDGEEGRQG